MAWTPEPPAGTPGRRLHQSYSARVPRDICYYDGLCGMCGRTRKVLVALDWLGRLEFRDMNGVTPEELPVPMSQAMLGMPMRTRDGRVLVGFPAVRRALTQTPVGCVPGLVLYVPGVSHVGRWCYQRLALNRARVCATNLRG